MLHVLTEYNLLDFYSSIQGPVIYYKYAAIGTNTYFDMVWDVATELWVGVQPYHVIYKRYNSIYIHPSDLHDTAYVWSVKTPGMVNISSLILRGDNGGDGINLYVNKNNDNIWTGFLRPENTAEQKFNITIQVNIGDNIYFRVNKNGNTAYDTVNWEPSIKYWDVADLNDKETTWEYRLMEYYNSSWI